MKLSLAEGLYLIALDDQEGRLLARAERSIVHGMLAAEILQLKLHNRIDIKDGVITVLDKSGTGNKLVDDILQAMGNGGKSIVPTLHELTPKFKDINQRAVDQLVINGILKKEATKLLWIPVSERMDNANYAFEKEIRETLHGIVFKGKKATPGFIVLFAIIYYCNLLEEVFTNKDDLIDAVKVAKDLPSSGMIDPEISKSLLILKDHFASL